MDKLIVSNIHKSFGTKEVLHDISFNVLNGELLSLLGPSGCGKTTLLRILIGLEEPDSGTIIKAGTEITHFPPSQRGMGIVFQNYALFENMTVKDNISYALKRKPEFKKDADKIAEHMLEVVGLQDYRNQKPHMLSGGQQQRVAIARTLALNPDIILFDEPMSALDVDTRLTLRMELKELQKTFHTTMIYITHDQEEAFALSDRIMVINEGHIHQLDTPQNIIDHPADDYVNRFVNQNIQLKIDSLTRFVRNKPSL